jgi:Tfp pilus assembly protein PilN
MATLLDQAKTLAAANGITWQTLLWGAVGLCVLVVVWIAVRSTLSVRHQRARSRKVAEALQVLAAEAREVKQHQAEAEAAAEAAAAAQAAQDEAASPSAIIRHEPPLLSRGGAGAAI